VRVRRMRTPYTIFFLFANAKLVVDFFLCCSLSQIFRSESQPCPDAPSAAP
jgi:hypothetical protein